MKALALLSGGLDSSLALKMIKDQGVDVTALHFTSPFCRCDGSKPCGFSAKEISALVNVEIKIKSADESYLEIIKNPRYGYGQNYNPCIDCRIYKFKSAKKIMEEINALSIVTGEVLGQRPKSQQRNTLFLIEKEAGLTGLIVRPLSAQLLPESIPEREKWIDRSKFLNISGRGRSNQIKLAKTLSLKGFSCPAGGCLLTDPSFCKRIKDLLESNMFNLNTINLAKKGRYFKLSNNTKLFVGRNEQDNEILKNLTKNSDIILTPSPLIPGPTGIIRSSTNIDTADIKTSAQIIARYIAPLNPKTDVHIFNNINGKITPLEIISSQLIDEQNLKLLQV
ncbi:tRNA (5-methylaminomethyl-2-thiouridylate)-methyltransferase [Candidatus Omnitrophus magneticus]|uniref:tRNA (5-methylaminomethyl-2-thiouridylate)-methyltransferase n=1 Tax=Candidatus Omnitrophus magneticus TaxID=1609969 RepID=A0A0F0CS68_9BACT|nr:tRNA (5-methylaminomethyl-2-thiouridylate)-methyltransferase [Candidatus Omnitrophus magneticus]